MKIPLFRLLSVLPDCLTFSQSLLCTSWTGKSECRDQQSSVSRVYVKCGAANFFLPTSIASLWTWSRPHKDKYIILNTAGLGRETMRANECWASQCRISDFSPYTFSSRRWGHSMLFLCFVPTFLNMENNKPGEISWVRLIYYEQYKVFVTAVHYKNVQ